MSVALSLLIAIAFGFSAMAGAADWRLVPKIGLSGGYDDNVLFRKDDILSSSVIDVEPAVELEVESLLSSLRLTANYEILRYLEESDLDRENQYYRLNGNHRLGQRWDSRIGFNYYKDSALRTYLEETGRILDRIDREYYYAMGGMAYNISTISSIDAQYRFETAIYDDDRYTDYDRHRVDLRYLHRLKSQQDTISIGPSFYYRTNDFNDTDYISLDLGWERDWSKITNTFASIGGRFVNVEEKDGDTRDEWGVRARLEMTRDGLQSTFNFKYYHDVDTDANGVDINVDNLRLQYDYRLTERLSLGLLGRLVLSYDLFSSSNDSNNAQDVEDSRYFEVRPYVGYRLTEKLSISMNYAYQNRSQDIVESKDTRERNRVWLQLNYEFPIML